MRGPQDLLPSEQVKQGDELLKAATELLEQRKGFTDEDNYMMARGLLTIANDHREGIDKKNAVRRSRQSRLYLDKAQETLSTVKRITEESVSSLNVPDEVLSSASNAAFLAPDTCAIDPLLLVPSSSLPPQIGNRSALIRSSHKISPVSVGWASEPSSSIGVTLAVSSLPLPPSSPPITTPPSRTPGKTVQLL